MTLRSTNEENLNVKTIRDFVIDALAGQPITFAFACAMAFGVGFLSLAFGIPH